MWEEEKETDDVNSHSIAGTVIALNLQCLMRQKIARKKLSKMRREVLMDKVMRMGFSYDEVYYGIQYANTISGVIAYIINKTEKE